MRYIHIKSTYFFSIKKFWTVCMSFVMWKKMKCIRLCPQSWHDLSLCCDYEKYGLWVPPPCTIKIIRPLHKIQLVCFMCCCIVHGLQNERCVNMLLYNICDHRRQQELSKANPCKRDWPWLWPVYCLIYMCIYIYIHTQWLICFQLR